MFLDIFLYGKGNKRIQNIFEWQSKLQECCKKWPEIATKLPQENSKLVSNITKFEPVSVTVYGHNYFAKFGSFHKFSRYRGGFVLKISGIAHWTILNNIRVLIGTLVVELLAKNWYGVSLGASCWAHKPE